MFRIRANWQLPLRRWVQIRRISKEEQQLEGQNQTLADKREPNTQRARTLTDSEIAFRNWVRKVPRNNDNFYPLGSGLAQFFEEVRHLVARDFSLMQDVIRKLAGEGGSRRIKEPVEQDFQRMSTAAKQQVLSHYIRPFFKIISKPDVLDSLVLESEVARIYNFISGINGSRATPLLSFLGETLAACETKEAEFFPMLEYSIVAFFKPRLVNCLQYQGSFQHTQQCFDL